MIENFSELYRKVNMDPPGELLTSRWEIIETLLAEWKEQDFISAVRIVRGLAAEEFRASLVKAFKEKDPAYPYSGKESETEVLAAACLFGFIVGKYNSDVKDFGALLLKASFPAEAKAIGEALAKLADGYIAKRASEIRDAGTSKGQEKFSKALAADFPVAFDQTAATELVKRLKSVDSRMQKMQAAHDALQEEANVLWWVFGTHSKSLNQSFGSSEEAECLIAGKELAELIKAFPGPSTPQAFLKKLLGSNASSKKVPLAKLLEAVPSEWQKSNSVEISKSMGDFRNELKELLYISYALVSAGEGGKPKDWFATLQQQEQLTTAQWLPIDAAKQFYFEMLTLFAFDIEGTRG